MIEVITLIIGIVAGFVSGFLFGKVKAYQSVDISAQVFAMNNLSTQIAEMKIKFEEIERQREKLDEEKEKRFKEFADSMT
ncbi:MAG: hypothetical protein OCU16_00720 [Candidatus Methanospirare jalkutatii]|nr:hypothetical protein [Candidatus Methanospirare jalkutatii]